MKKWHEHDLKFATPAGGVYEAKSYGDFVDLSRGLYKRYAPLAAGSPLSEPANLFPEMNQPRSMTNTPASPAAQPEGGPAKPPRLLSLDALRGFDMFWIVGADALMEALRKLSDGPVVQGPQQVMPRPLR